MGGERLLLVEPVSGRERRVTGIDWPESTPPGSACDNEECYGLVAAVQASENAGAARDLLRLVSGPVQPHADVEPPRQGKSSRGTLIAVRRRDTASGLISIVGAPRSHAGSSMQRRGCGTPMPPHSPHIYERPLDVNVITLLDKGLVDLSDRGDSRDWSSEATPNADDNPFIP